MTKRHRVILANETVFVLADDVEWNHEEVIFHRDMTVVAVFNASVVYGWLEVDEDTQPELPRPLPEGEPPKWIPNFRHGMYPDEAFWLCTKCTGQSWKKTRFCGHCGSRMEGTDEAIT